MRFFFAALVVAIAYTGGGGCVSKSVTVADEAMEEPEESYPAVALELNEAAFRPYNILGDRPSTHEEAIRSAEHLRAINNWQRVVQGTCISACGTRAERRILVLPFTAEELRRLNVDFSEVQWVVVRGE